MGRAEGARSRLKIYFDILSVIEEGGEARPTHILYRANLSHERLTAYIEELKQRGLVVEAIRGDGKTFALTQQGKKFLKELRRAQAFLSGFGISL